MKDSSQVPRIVKVACRVNEGFAKWHRPLAKSHSWSSFKCEIKIANNLKRLHPDWPWNKGALHNLTSGKRSQYCHYRKWIISISGCSLFREPLGKHRTEVFSNCYSRIKKRLKSFSLRTDQLISIRTSEELINEWMNDVTKSQWQTDKLLELLFATKNPLQIERYVFQDNLCLRLFKLHSVYSFVNK